MKIGFTGTRNGMTLPQRSMVIKLIAALQITEAHEGDCVGSDAEFKSICDTLLTPEAIVVHPPIKGDVRAFAIKTGNTVRELKGYFARNRDIVDETEFLIGTPPAMVELSEGGTWYTINYARKKSKPVAIVWPDGSIRLERYPHSYSTLGGMTNVVDETGVTTSTYTVT